MFKWLYAMLFGDDEKINKRYKSFRVKQDSRTQL